MLHESMDEAAIEPRGLNPGASRILLSDSLMAEKTEDDDAPEFPPLSSVGGQSKRNAAEYRRVRCPPHRYTPLREHWEQILTPLVEYLKLQVRAENAVSLSL